MIFIIISYSSSHYVIVVDNNALIQLLGNSDKADTVVVESHVQAEPEISTMPLPSSNVTGESASLASSLTTDYSATVAASLATSFTSPPTVTRKKRGMQLIASPTNPKLVVDVDQKPQQSSPNSLPVSPNATPVATVK